MHRSVFPDCCEEVPPVTGIWDVAVLRDQDDRMDKFLWAFREFLQNHPQLGIRNNGKESLHSSRRPKFLRQKVYDPVEEVIKRYHNATTQKRKGSPEMSYRITSPRVVKPRSLSPSSPIAERSLSPTSPQSTLVKPTQPLNYLNLSTRQQIGESAINSLRHRIDKVYNKFFHSDRYNQLTKMKIQILQRDQASSGQHRLQTTPGDTTQDSTQVLGQVDTLFSTASALQQKEYEMRGKRHLYKILPRREDLESTCNNIFTRPIKKIFEEQKVGLILIPEKRPGDKLLKQKDKSPSSNSKPTDLFRTTSNNTKACGKNTIPMPTKVNQLPSQRPRGSVVRDHHPTPASRLVHSHTEQVLPPDKVDLSANNSRAVKEYKQRVGRYHKLLDKKIQAMGVDGEIELIGWMLRGYSSTAPKRKALGAVGDRVALEGSKKGKGRVLDTAKQIRRGGKIDNNYLI